MGNKSWLNNIKDRYEAFDRLETSKYNKEHASEIAEAKKEEEKLQKAAKNPLTWVGYILCMLLLFWLISKC